MENQNEENKRLNSGNSDLISEISEQIKAMNPGKLREAKSWWEGHPRYDAQALDRMVEKIRSA